jgi:hypothetical protein
MNRIISMIKNNPTKVLLSINILYDYYGTGSYPPLWNGWHRKILLTDITPPLRDPYFFIDSIAYSEHVGQNRQDGENMGDNTS